MIEPVWIKPSFSIMLRQYAKVALLLSILPLIYLLSDGNKNLILGITLSFWIPFLGLFLFELFSNKLFEPILEISIDGLRIFKKHSYQWHEIEEIKIIYRRISQKRTLQNGRRSVEEKKTIRINEQEFDFSGYYLKFSPEQIVEIIQLYKDKMNHLKQEIHKM